MVLRTLSTIAVLALMALAVNTGIAEAEVVGTADAGSLGTILVDENRMTLYTLSADMAGMSMCSDACLGPWPAAIVNADAAAMLDSGASGMPALGTMTRTDGTGVQVTWDGMPLYRFVRDAAPGDVNGNGVNAFGGTWMVVQVAM